MLDQCVTYVQVLCAIYNISKSESKQLILPCCLHQHGKIEKANVSHNMITYN